MADAIGKESSAIGKESAKLAAAVVAGYLIGRTRKGKVVLMLACGVLLAGRALAQMGLDQSKLRGVLGEVLADVQRSGGKALNARAESLTDTLRSRSGVISGLGLDQDEAADDEEDEGEADEADDEPAESTQASNQSNEQASDRNGGGREAERSSRSPNRARNSGGTSRRGREAQAATRGRR